MSDTPERPVTNEEKEAAIKGLIDRGVTFADFLGVWAAGRDTPEARKYIALAREQWHEEGQVEIDDVTITGGSSARGDYVLAWVWVDAP